MLKKRSTAVEVCHLIPGVSMLSYKLRSFAAFTSLYQGDKLKISMVDVESGAFSMTSWKSIAYTHYDYKRIEQLPGI